MAFSFLDQRRCVGQIVRFAVILCVSRAALHPLDGLGQPATPQPLPVGATGEPLGAGVPAAGKDSSVATPASSATLSSDLVNPLHSVLPSSLLEMRLHPSHLPLEAELSCSWLFGCQLGLSRGFALSSDAANMVGVTLLGQHFLGTGAWTYADAALGYQFIRLAERQATLMGTLGYRAYSYKNSENAKLARAGFMFRTAYAESVVPAYTQSLVFDAFSSSLTASGGADQPFTRSDTKRVRSLVKEFIQFTRSNPLIRLQMPADLEIINWKPSQVDLPSALRGFLRINPIYEQADLVLKTGNESIYTWSEKRFALQLMLMSAYASPEQKSGRLGLTGGLGFEMAATTDSLESKAQSPDLNPVLPDPTLISGKLEIQVTYQF
jgi:hypothetical protein